MKQRNSEVKGFTLIELLISFAIMVIFGTLTAVNVLHYQPDFEVDASAEKVYSQLLYARNLALSGSVLADQLGGPPPPGGSPFDDPPDGLQEVPNGYGMYLDTAATPVTFWLYGDLYDPAFYVPEDSETILGNFRYDPTTDGKPEKISSQAAKIEEKVELTIRREDTGNEGDLSTPASPKPLEIFFEAPKGTMMYYYDNIPYNAVTGINKISFTFRHIEQGTVSQRLFVERLTNQVYYENE